LERCSAGKEELEKLICKFKLKLDLSRGGFQVTNSFSILVTSGKFFDFCKNVQRIIIFCCVLI
jgi:hypothetical protein